MFREHIEYFKDNPKGLWFKRKLYGYGWTPVKWQGWLVVFVYVASLVYFIVKIEEDAHSFSDTLIGLTVPFIILTSVVIFISYKKGENPRRQWGVEDK